MMWKIYTKICLRLENEIQGEAYVKNKSIWMMTFYSKLNQKCLDKIKLMLSLLSFWGRGCTCTCVCVIWCKWQGDTRMQRPEEGSGILRYHSLTCSLDTLWASLILDQGCQPAGFRNSTDSIAHRAVFLFDFFCFDLVLEFKLRPFCLCSKRLPKEPSLQHLGVLFLFSFVCVCTRARKC